MCRDEWKTYSEDTYERENKEMMIAANGSNAGVDLSDLRERSSKILLATQASENVGNSAEIRCNGILSLDEV